MSAIVNYQFYTDVYKGSEVDSTSFPALNARAEDIICALTRWAVNDETIANFPSLTQTLFKKAICAQVDYFGINGVEIMSTGSDRGFTVGKVSISGKTNSLAMTGKMAEYLAPLAMMYLEQSGLMSPHVETWGW